jgi:hypothetical protein
MKTDMNIVFFKYIYDLSKSTTFQLFKPERFLQEDMVERNPYSFLPFSAGSR